MENIPIHIIIPGLAQAVDPKLVEMAATKLSEGYVKYKEKKKKKGEEKPEEDDGNQAKDDSETNL